LGSMSRRSTTWMEVTVCGVKVSASMEIVAQL
jgi:hypothetical protein